MRWTEEEIKYLEKWHKLKTYDEIGKQLGKSESAVKTYACRHNIQKDSWTKEEEAYLERMFSRRTNKQIAKMLQRSETAVSTRANKLELGARREYDDDIDMAVIGRLVGKNASVIRRSWTKLGLNYYLRCNRYKMVKPKDLFEFMKSHPELWNATECEKYYFENEDWFRTKLLEDRQKMCDARWGVVSA